MRTNETAVIPGLRLGKNPMLPRLLEGVEPSSASSARREWLSSVVAWVNKGAGTAARIRRFYLLLDLLEAQPERRARVARTFQDILDEFLPPRPTEGLADHLRQAFQNAGRKSQVRFLTRRSLERCCEILELRLNQSRARMKAAAEASPFDYLRRIGEHCIARTATERNRLFLAALGGGLVTCGTILGKFWNPFAHSSPLAQAVSLSLNYSLSFLLMQALGFTLATKQPAMSAVAISRAIPRRFCPEGLLALARTIVQAIKSQAVAISGNLLAVVAAAWAVQSLLHANGVSAVPNAAKSRELLAQLDFFQPSTIGFAAFTGVLLWLSCLISGWVRSRVKSDRIAGISLCVALGTLLGTVPVLGKLLGLPLDVRHITLSTGSVFLAAGSLGLQSALQAGLLKAVLGLGAVAVLNFGVAFACSWNLSIRFHRVRVPRLGLLLQNCFQVLLAPTNPTTQGGVR